MDYSKELCYGCGKIFSEGDDIVVCPECGTPQHRECWEKERKCVNSHLHGDGFEWKPKHREPEIKAEERTVPLSREVILCPFCGHENPPDAVECENCSQPFQLFGKNILGTESSKKDEKSGGYAYKPPFEVHGEEPAGDKSEASPEFGKAEPFMFNGTALDSEVGGTPTKDFVSYIRASVPSYYKKFKKAESGKHTFNFAAFFFGAYWYFFRKLYKPGIIFLSLTFCITLAFRNPLTEGAEKYMNVAQRVSEALSENEQPDEKQLEALYADVAEVTGELMPTVALFTACQLLVNIAAAFFADRLYRKKYLDDMNFISKAKFISDPGLSQEQARFITVTKTGGISLLAPALAYLAVDVLSRILETVFFT